MNFAETSYQHITAKKHFQHKNTIDSTLMTVYQNKFT